MTTEPHEPNNEHGTRERTPAQVPVGLPAPFAVGDTVPNREMWILERKLGGGGFGEVWLARHEWKEDRVAVKFCLDSTIGRKLVMHEKKVIARVMKYGGDHPNVVPLIDCNLSGEIPWLMYEYVDGGTLAEACIAWGKIDKHERFVRALDALRAIASALAKFHQLEPPIVHRDLKPHNVLMAGTVPRLTDFGIGGAAKAVSVSESTPATTDFSIRLPTVLKGAGSIRYSSPEQMLGSTPDPRDDVYSLGVIAYQLLVGSLQSGPGSDAGDELCDLGVSPQVAKLVANSVANNPERRPRDAADWAKRLRAAEALSPPVAPPPPPPPPAEPGADEFARAETAVRAQTFDTALKLYASAAALGHAGAALALGRLHRAGTGTAADTKLAREWYEKASALGSADAAFAVGELCDSSRDYTGAKEWYERAAKAGHASAQYALGVLYRLGRGVKQDYLAAHDWTEKAAAQNHEVAQFTLGLQYDLGQGVAASTALAREWYLKAAAQGNADAANTLGEHHEAGRGVPADAKEALRWYKIAAAKGHAGAKKSIDRITRRKR
jgi:TPR repeat protein